MAARRGLAAIVEPKGLPGDCVLGPGRGVHVIWLIAGQLKLTLANHALYDQAHGFELACELALETMVGHLLLVGRARTGIGRPVGFGSAELGRRALTLGAVGAPWRSADGENCS